MVMKTAEATAVSEAATDVGEDSNDATKLQETTNTRKRILDKANYDDLEGPEAKKAAPLTLSNVDRYMTGPTPVSSQDYLTQDEVIKARANLQQELKIWKAQRNPNVLSSNAAVRNLL